MALQDKFDSAFTNKLLKKTLMSGNQQQNTTVTANDNSYELTKSNLITISNSFTSLQNAFNKIYSHSLNVQNLHQYDEKRMANIKKESNLESKIAPNAASTSITNNSGDSLSSTASTLDSLASSVEKLNDKMKKINLSGSGYSNAMLLGDGVGSSSRSRLGRIGGRALGIAGVGLDVYGRYQGGQSAGQIAAGTGGGLAGAALGAKAGAVAGGAVGAFFFGAGAVPGAAIGSALGGIGGYFAGSTAGDAAYDTLNRRASGGGVKAGGTYVVGERGPEVLMLGGMSGKVIANGQRSSSPSEKYLTAAADKSSRAATKVIKGQPLGPTSYSSKFSNYLSSLFGNMPNWLNRIKDYLGFGDERGPGGSGILGPGQYAAVGDLSKATGDWKNDAEFITAVNAVAQKYNIDANDLLGLMYNESAGSMSPSIRGRNGATGLFQFMPQYFDTAAIARMTRAQQVALADEKIFAASGLPRGANAGQIYASVFLPSIARNQGWSGVISRSGDKYYSSNPGLDTNKDGMIDYNDLANKISEHRVRMGLGPSPSLVGTMSTQGFVTPVAGPVGSGFRSADRPNHEGLDFPIPAGNPVRAAKAGTIQSARPRDGYGNTIIIDHGNGVTTLYAHLREFLKTSGTVQQGEIIARSGGVPGEPGAGRTTGAHLHFEVRMNGRSVDPGAYLATATPEQRTPTTGLPAGYRREGRADAQRKMTVPYIITPNGASFPASVTSAQNITNFNSLNPQTQNEILTYFRLK